LIEADFLEVWTMIGRVQDGKAEFTPQLDEIKAMARQDVAVARERLAEGRAMVSDYVVREPVKALGIALCIGVVLGWLIGRS
jgi:ElaB/YqjD/DUF883 family membrane-anchored ribosome-binding protein